MPAEVVRLARPDEVGLEELLAAAPIVNLFLIGFLSAHPVDRAWWYGVVTPDEVRAAVLVVPGRLAVPFAPSSDDALRLGRHLRDLHRPSLLVGPREAADALIAGWAPELRPQRSYDQRLYVLSAPPPGEDPPGFRRATWEDRLEVAAHAAAMEREDLGTDPIEENARLHEQVIEERVKAGRTFVIERDGRLVFQVNVGTTHPLGCQIGGTWVPPDARGRGLAIAGVAATCRRLLQRWPRVTLHVNEANAPAVAVYERVGFVRDAPFRLWIP